MYIIFRNLKRSFAKNNFAGKTTLNDVDKNQSDLFFEARKLKKA